MPETLTGQIQRITYTDDDSGYTVAQMAVDGVRDPVTVVGNLLAPAVGEVLEMEGDWVRHPRFGDQFKVVASRSRVPATAGGIERYLGSGLIQGLGPKMARRIVQRFGDQALSVIETELERLAEIPGIGPKRMAQIRSAWNSQRDVRDVMIFLQSCGVGPAWAVRIFKRYGQRSIAVVRANPYRLATDIAGIGFVTADRIAEKLGLDRQSPLRIGAGLLYVLGRFMDEGHVFYPYEPLVERCCKDLDVGREAVVAAADEAVRQRRIVVEDFDDPPGFVSPRPKGVYLSWYHFCEHRSAELLADLIQSPRSVTVPEPERALAWVERRLTLSLAPRQAEAVRCAMTAKAMVITGGPGTGKTTIVNAVVQAYVRLGARVVLAAPTGRAAKRLEETVGLRAMTIHRLLEFSFQKGGFQRHEKNPVEADLIVVDEASMLDTALICDLLRAMPREAVLVLVGDVDQLPSVGPGSVLGDIMASGVVPVVALTEIFRQARHSRIVVNAHRINSGQLPQSGPSGGASDFFFIEQENPEAVVDMILRLVGERIPRRFGLDPIDQVQVLSPMHRGVAGAGNLNLALQQVLNPGDPEVVRGDRHLRTGDKVMQIRNNYDKQVFNGDMGRIVHVDADDQTLTVRFDVREVGYDFADLDEIALSYAVSVHKSQGSEYPAVVMPVLVQHYLLLQRNLLYTAVTRGRRLVVLVGTRKALAMAVSNNQPRLRHTRLAHRLKDSAQP